MSAQDEDELGLAGEVDQAVRKQKCSIGIGLHIETAKFMRGRPGSTEIMSETSLGLRC